jgi:hypothetical protein
MNPVLIERVRRARAEGLGDRIAAIAQPVAGVIDKMTGTNIMGCGGCNKMKKRLNAGMSLTEAIKLRIQRK